MSMFEIKSVMNCLKDMHTDIDAYVNKLSNENRCLNERICHLESIIKHKDAQIQALIQCDKQNKE